MTNTYKLIALDVDGTILTSRHTIAPETREAVRQAMAGGVRVTLATGRGFPSALAVARELGLRGTPLVTHDGGYVADPDSGEVIQAERIPLDVTAEAAVLLQGLGLHVNLLHEERRISSQRLPNFRWSMLLPQGWKAIRVVLDELRSYPTMYAPDLKEYLRVNPVAPPKFYVTGTPEAVRAGAAAIAERLGAVLRTAAAGPRAMEVIPRHISKASGLRTLGDALGIAPAEMIGMGDGHNDVEMISQAGLGVAMGNAPEDVRKLAKFITRTNDEHGVAYAIQRFVLGQGARSTTAASPKAAWPDTPPTCG